MLQLEIRIAAIICQNLYQYKFGDEKTINTTF